MRKIYFITLLFVSLVSNAQITPTSNSTEVGVTEGELSVSLNGSAGYNIPIAVPPGINGVEPKIGLSYNSNSGNGIAGYGWNISGLSVITRIPSTKHHDNAIDPVDNDQLDRFALDGKRLILRADSPTQIYKYPNAIYETEGFSNIKVTHNLYNQIGYFTPIDFTVKYPDGSTAYYGGNSNYTDGNTWFLNYWENAQGVRISYTYNIPNTTSSNNIFYEDETTLNSIKYGTAGVVAPINEVLFVYKPRIRVDTRFSTGYMAYKNVNILDKIVVKGYGGSNYRSYKLTHDTVSGYERLLSVTESVLDNGVEKKYNPTVFTYSENQVTNNQQIEYSLSYQSTYKSADTYSNYTVQGDFDGDKEIDYLHSYCFSSFKSIYKTDYNGYLSETIIPLDLTGYSENGINTGFRQLHPVIGLEGDINSGFKFSNKTFLTILKEDNSKIRVYSYNQSSNSLNIEYEKNTTLLNGYLGEYYDNATKFLSGDFNGDSLTDLIYRVGGELILINLDKRITTDYEVNIGNISSPILQTGDFNGDGKLDIIVFKESPQNEIQIFTLNSENNALIQLFSYSYTITTSEARLLGDYNGDGKTDILFTSGKTLFSVGNSFAIELLSNFPVIDYTSRLYIMDLNNDNKDDILNIRSYDTTIPNSGNPLSQYHLSIKMYSRCQNQANPWLYIESTYDGHSIYHADYDVYAQPLHVRKSKLYPDKMEIPINIHQWCNSNVCDDLPLKIFNINAFSSTSTQLKTITLGNGTKETITYAPMVNGNGTYTASQESQFPYVDIINSINTKVVSKIEKQTEFSYTKQLFKYHNAVSNTEGLGFIGFKSIMKTNWHNDDYPIQSTISNYDILKRGALVEEYQVLGLQSPSTNYTTTDYIEKKTYAYDATLLPNKVFKIKNTSSLYHNALIDTSVEKTNTYNDYNILTQSITSTKNALIVEKTDVIDIVPENITNGIYVIGRPISKTQTTTIFPLNQASETTTAQELYAYNGINLLSQLQKKGHNTVFVIEDYQYDTWGNKKQKTISATGLASRTEKFDYDDLTHRFLTKSYDVNDLVTEYSYNNVTGLLTSVKNPLLQTATYSYDKWGKKIQETDFQGVSNTFTYFHDNYEGGAYFVMTEGDSGDKIIQYDRLGRVIAERDNFNGNAVFYEYDIYDRRVKTSKPFNEYIVTTIPWNEIKYDEYGRPYEAIDFKGKITSISYLGLITLTEEGPKTTETLRNSLGETISLTDNGGTIEYQYFANGNMKKSIYNGIETVFEQDGWGRKTKMFEPSAGRYIYTYNHYGELLTESSLKGTTTYNYDDFGNLTFKTVVGKTSAESTNIRSDYTYDATKRVTNIAVTNPIDGNSNYLYEYDTVTKQLNKVTETLPQATFIKQYTFDNKGRVQTEKSRIEAHSKASENVVYYTYENNKLWKINKTNASGELLYHIIEKNENEQIVNASYGNGITIANTFDAFGYPLQYKHDKGTTNIMTLTNTFDTVKSNLLTRSNNIGTFNWSEDFTNSYDDLDRLNTYKNANSISETQTYEPDGRIESNALGTYNYTGTSNTPYKNTSVTLSDEAKAYYGTRGALTIPYNAFMNPIKITETGKEVLYFGYNAEGDRSVMYYGNTSGNKLTSPFRKYYSADGTMEVKYTLATTSVPEKVEFFTYIGGDAYSAPIVSKQDDSAASNYFYLHRDYLGSILAITNNLGAVIEKRQFDAWGGIVGVQDGSGVALTKLTFFDRGYTGHEHLQGVALIHMNGRLYDPKLHRFLQPDNYVQDPYNSQHFNRYSYGLNNPLRYTDPSGESLLDFLGFLFYSYVSTAQATGQANPTKWNSDTWINIGLGGGSMLVSAGLTNGTNNYIDNYNNAGQPGETFSDGFIDTVNPVNMVKGIWQSGVDNFNAGSNIITGNGTIEDYSTLAEGVMPVYQMAKGLATLGYQAAQGDEYAQGSLAAQVVVILVTRKAGSFKPIVKYTKSNVRIGMEMHKAYKFGLEGKEFRLPSGKRIDYLDIKNRTIHELKPFNPKSFKQGQKQLRTYKQELESMPRFEGIKWKTVLDFY